MNSEKDLLAWVMYMVNIGPQVIGDHVYENMESRYNVCVEVVGRHIEPFL